MNCNIGVYAKDMLLLTELLDLLDEKMPLAQVSVYSGKDYMPDAGSGRTVEIKDMKGIMDEDVFVILSDASEDIEEIKKFDSDIVDCTGIFEGVLEDVNIVSEPVKNIISSVSNISGNNIEVSAFLPVAIFGKNGIEDLLSQTRSVFSFQNKENRVISGNIAFNILFAESEGRGVLGSYAANLEQETGVAVDVRLAPLSTVFMLDIYGADESCLDLYEEIDLAQGLTQVSELNEIYAAKTKGSKITLVGDYIKNLVYRVYENISELVG